MMRWHPRLELARPLEALSQDIIAATEEELRQIQDVPLLTPHGESGVNY